MKALLTSSAAMMLASAAICQVALPPHSNIYNGFTRGYTFTSATNFIIQQLDLPLDAYQAGDTAGYMVRVNGTQAHLSRGNAGPVSTSILVNPGDIVDVLGNWSPAVPGNFTAHNSYSASATNFATTILGVPHTIQRSGWQWDIGDPALAGAFLAPTTGQIGRVFMYVTPQAGLYANFTADVTAGPIGTTVNFTDSTFTSDPSGVLTWAWDLNGDTVVDSNVQNPSFTYTACGAYDVSLTVTDATNPASTITRTGYIQIGVTPITPSFTFAPLGGGAYQFTDTSSPLPASWAWDFNGDTVVDSTVQNPVWAYGACDTNAAVSLSVSSNCAGPYTTSQNIVLQPPITPSFTFASIAPGVFQFTDTSSPVPSSWAWDLDGDNLVDSTAQNPVWAYAAPCTSVNVSLSVSSSCAGPWSTSKAIVLSPLSATAVPFLGGNGTTSATFVGNMFDMQVTNPAGISVCAITQGIYTYSGPFTADIYITDGTYIGKEANASAWRLVASGTGTAAGGPVTPSTPYPVALNHSFYLPAGNYGMVVFLSRPGGSMNVSYTNSPQGPFSNGDVTFNPNPATAPGRVSTTLFTGSGIVGRCWNGTLHYSTAGNGDQAGYGFFGPGCAGSLGTTNLSHSAPPVIGTTMNVTLNNLPSSAAILLTGFSKTASVFGPLPLSTTPYGAPGCFARVSTDASRFLFGASNSAVWTFNIPNDPGVVGLNMYNQALVLDPGFNALGAVLSDAAGMMIGL